VNDKVSIPYFSVNLLLSRTSEPESVISFKDKVTLTHLICGILEMCFYLPPSPQCLQKAGFCLLQLSVQTSQFLKVLQRHPFSTKIYTTLMFRILKKEVWSSSANLSSSSTDPPLDNAEWCISNASG